MHVGPIVSSDLFYNPDEGQYERWSKRGVLAVEMEAAALFTVGALRGVQAGCLLIVSDIIVEGEFKRVTDDEMKAAVDRMTRVALATATCRLISDTVFLVNPASANGSTGRRWAEMAHRAATSGLEGDTLFSERPGQLGDLARDAADGGAKLLVVVGGDGSVNEVANGIAGRDDVEIAVIPRGTGWDFSRTYKIPHKLDGAIDVALTGTSRTIDLGRASYRAWDGSEAESYFANVASAGMSGAIAQRANETTKALGGKVSYLWATLAVFARWQNSELRLTVDDETRVGHMHDVVVANGKTFGGGMIICPDAEPDDGLFDVLTIGDLTKRDLLVTLPKTYRGTHLPHPKAELLRGAVVTVDADAPLPVELDGEQPGTTPVRFEIVPRRAAAARPRGLGGRVLRSAPACARRLPSRAGFFTVAAPAASRASRRASRARRGRAASSASRRAASSSRSSCRRPSSRRARPRACSAPRAPSSVKRARMSFCLAVLVFPSFRFCHGAIVPRPARTAAASTGRAVISARTTSEAGDRRRHPAATTEYHRQHCSARTGNHVDAASSPFRILFQPTRP